MATSNDGASWSTGNDRPANVSVDELFWMGSKLVAVTHGRGMFIATPALGPASFHLEPSLSPAGTEMARSIRTVQQVNWPSKTWAAQPR